jgi:hypothetical protein
MSRAGHGAADGGALLARRLRGSVLVGFTALLTAVGHLAGGGALPDLGLLVVLLPALAWPVIAVADRCRGPLATTLVLGLGQLLLHTFLTTVHAHHGVGGSRMLAMHVAVTALSVVGLRSADRGLTALFAALSRVVPRRLAVPPVAVAHLERPVRGPAVPARIRRALAATHVRRGPPVCC